MIPQTLSCQRKTWSFPHSPSWPLSSTETPAAARAGGAATAAFAPLEASVHFDEGIKAAGDAIRFPNRAAWLTLERAVAPGWHRLTIRASAPMFVLEVLMGADAIAIPLHTNADGALAVTFGLDRAASGLRLLPVEGGEVRFERVLLEPSLRPESLLPLWEVGGVSLPHANSSPSPGGAAAGIPRPGAGSRITIEALDRIKVRGHTLQCGDGGAMLLRFDPPLGRGRHRISAEFFTDEMTPALVAPLIYAPGAPANARPLARFQQDRGAVYRCTIRLDERTDHLVLKPREEAGTVTIEKWAVRRQTGAERIAGATALGVSRTAAAIGNGAERLVGGDPSRDGRLLALLRLATIRDRRHRRAGLGPRAATRQLLGLNSAPRYTPARAADASPLEGDWEPSVSIVTPTKDAASHLARYLETVAQTRWPRVQIILVDNGSSDPAAQGLLAQAQAQGIAKVVIDDRPFNFPALCNLGAASAAGEVLVFANNDISFNDPDWLTALIAPLRDAAVGVTGARLTYPDGRVQHAGMVLAGEARIRHLDRYLWGKDAGHWGWQQSTQHVAAVTGALMAVRAPTFARLSGFRADRYPVLYNDADLCLRAQAEGLSCLFVGKARAEHRESVTFGRPRHTSLLGRGSPHWRMMRAVEAARFRHDWGKLLDADPCYPELCDPLEARFFAKR